MINATIPVDTISVQLLGGAITTPATVQFRRNALEVEIAASNHVYNFQFILASSKIRLVMREMTVDGVVVSAIDLYDFANPPAEMLHLVASRSGSVPIEQEG